MTLLLARVMAAFITLSAITASASAGTFRYSTSGDVLGLDPYLNNEGPTNAIKDNIYEGLLHRAWDLSLQPALATEWEQIEPTRWRFKLREGVTFHNNNPFNADDVLTSFERIRSEQSDMSFAVTTIERIDKIDDYTIDIITSAPDPTLLLSLPRFWIMDEEWLEQNNAITVARGATASHYANTHANGTGPFILVERVVDTRTVLEPNPHW